jgi:serine/threonine protein kinase/Flp pilus assembly protein TadD
MLRLGVALSAQEEFEADVTGFDERSEPGYQFEAHEDTLGAIPRIHLRDTADASRLIRMSSTEKPNLSGQTSRYQLVGELARGGMGVVFLGRDLDLGRDLAVKVIRDEHRDHPETVRRFVEEAQIGGQLQHPGIVPVHELGRLADGRLFIAMKLVRGRTLAALLTTRQALDEDRMRFLSIFENVCQTMAYAHARGVIHRDLKPSNVMVGSFGEVQVMDWGLAKVLDQGGIADEAQAIKAADEASAVQTLRSGSSAMESRAGSVLGTPSYMAPEQARGALDTLDERADVFALGAILCEILTGQPAFTGGSGAELYRKVQRADLSDALARLDACAADAELTALARLCLAATPKHRPRDAGIVMERLTAYLRGVEKRLREAELAQARAETRADGERRRRVLAVALTVTVLASGLIGAAGWGWMNHERQRREQAMRSGVDAALAEASKKRDTARDLGGSDAVSWVEAIEAARRAELLLGGHEVTPELRGRVQLVLTDLTRERDAIESAEKDRRIVERLAATHNDLGVHNDQAKADAEYAVAFRAYGVDLNTLDPDAAGKVLAACPAVADLANALDQWAILRRGRALRDPAGAAKLVAVARAADPDPWRNALRDTLGRNEEAPARRLEDLERLAATADVERLPVASVTRLAASLGFFGRKETAVALLRRAQASHRDDFWVNADLGSELMASGRPDEAIQFFAVATGVRPRSGLALSGLGKALFLGGQSKEAAEIFRELTRLKPEDALGRVALGSSLLSLGQSREAEDQFHLAKRLKPDDWMVRDQIAMAYSEHGDWVEAIDEQRESVRTFPNLAVVHKALAHALQSAGRLAESIAEFREAVRLDSRFSAAYLFLGRALIEAGDYRGALDALKKVDSGPPPPDPILSKSTLIARAEQFIALEPRLLAVVEGADLPADAEEFVAFARLAYAQRSYKEAAQLWTDAFTTSPEIASDMALGDRFQAVRAAALAPLREQAVAWLEADLAASAVLVETGGHTQRSAVNKRLGRWQADPALASLRDDPSLQPFWNRVKALRSRAAAIESPGRGHVTNF